MSFREYKSAADKLGSFVELIQRAQKVLEAAAQAEQQEQSLRDAIVSSERLAADARAREVDAKEALQRATDAVKLATANAAEIEDNARQRASQIVSDAGKTASKIEQAAHELAENAKKLASDSRSDIAVAKAERAAARAELEDLNKRIEAAKASARQTFGG